MLVIQNEETKGAAHKKNSGRPQIPAEETITDAAPERLGCGNVCECECVVLSSIAGVAVVYQMAYGVVEKSSAALSRKRCRAIKKTIAERVKSAKCCAWQARGGL